MHKSTSFTLALSVWLMKEDSKGREPWSSGYGRRLMFQRSWVWIPAPYTGWIFFHIYLLKNCNVCLKRRKKVKEARDEVSKLWLNYEEVNFTTNSLLSILASKQTEFHLVINLSVYNQFGFFLYLPINGFLILADLHKFSLMELKPFYSHRIAQNANLEVDNRNSAGLSLRAPDEKSNRISLPIEPNKQ